MFCQTFPGIICHVDVCFVFCTIWKQWYFKFVVNLCSVRSYLLLKSTGNYRFIPDPVIRWLYVFFGSGLFFNTINYPNNATWTSLGFSIKYFIINIKAVFPCNLPWHINCMEQYRHRLLTFLWILAYDQLFGPFWAQQLRPMITVQIRESPVDRPIWKSSQTFFINLLIEKSFLNHR